MKDARSQVRHFVSENFLFGQEQPDFQDGTSFLESGVIDSTGVLELIGFLETTFGVELKPEELVPENLDSVDAIVKFLEQRLPKSVPVTSPLLAESIG